MKIPCCSLLNYAMQDKTQNKIFGYFFRENKKKLSTFLCYMADYYLFIYLISEKSFQKIYFMLF